MHIAFCSHLLTIYNPLALHHESTFPPMMEPMDFTFPPFTGPTDFLMEPMVLGPEFQVLFHGIEANEADTNRSRSPRVAILACFTQCSRLS